MTTSILRPNATSVAGGVVNGAASGHAATSDDSDASYVTSDAASGSAGIYDVGTVTLPAGAVTKTLTVRARMFCTEEPPVATVEAVNAAGGVWATLATSSVSIAIFSTHSGGGSPVSLTQAEVDALRVSARTIEDGGSIRFAELYLDLVYALVPVANITYPTGTPAITTTNKPTYTWTHTPGSDGGSQSFYEIKVYTAAQYGAGGFSPDTSSTHWTSGIVVGSATSQVSGVLANSTTYRVYVRTAQTINGVAHWSVWDFEGFSIAITTADVSAITTTADSANGRILVAVDRSGSAWDFVEVQRSTDAGTTWEYVRGGEYVPPATTTVFSTGDASNFDIYDYESANAATVIYRARATRIVTGLSLTGAWVQSTPAISWTSTSTFLKAPDTPTLNQTVIVHDFQTVEHPVRQGVLPVLGRAAPIVVSETVRQLAVGQFALATLDAATADALWALIETPGVLLFQAPSPNRFGSRYIVVGPISETRAALRSATAEYMWSMSFVEVDTPADPLAGSP